MIRSSTSNRLNTPRELMEVDLKILMLGMKRESIRELISNFIEKLENLGELPEFFDQIKSLGYEEVFIDILAEVSSHAYLQFLELIDGEVEFFPKIDFYSPKMMRLPPLAPTFRKASPIALSSEFTYKDVRNVEGVMHTETAKYEKWLRNDFEINKDFREYVFSMIAKCVYRVSLNVLDKIDQPIFNRIVLDTTDNEFAHFLSHIIEEPIDRFFEVCSGDSRRVELSLFVGKKRLDDPKSTPCFMSHYYDAFAGNISACLIEGLITTFSRKDWLCRS